ncbi:MAG: phage tail protein [Mixta calida]|uniref:phage tail protein n=1 Tax=Mixta calida TaxID=665913 RepID=UPI00290A3C8A|nr:phage tail protein [Mixta calida]MBS6058306.1 phage tail protein [Pantoea sp.]MDU4943841.1 phage tail protein [Mixta calida]MDU6539164.1 phage tail protein [Mixta calida]
MAIDTFNWCVRVGASEELNVATLQAQFGDGYKQVASAGINTAMESWPVTCSGTKSEMATLRAFLKSHVISSFWWTNPWGEKKLYRVKSDSIRPNFVNGNFVEISFTFEQAFAP